LRSHLAERRKILLMSEQKLPAASRRMITRTLRSLERDGLAVRTVQPRPIQVSHALTDVGQSLGNQVRSLNRWAQANHAAILDARGTHRGAED